ncbi:hypothetical protein F4823DRAFT_622839 [Ustulina deusta]|nr:hypothetical protein F4823DRAFT_622839 [Ustulina deusta]
MNGEVTIPDREPTQSLCCFTRRNRVGRSQASVEQRQIIEDPTFDLPWYRWWALEQIRKQPEYLLLSLPDFLAPGPRSINSTTDMLICHKFVNTEGSYEAILSVKDLVFAIIGLQTMLCQPCFDPGSPGEYRVLDKMSGYRGTTRISFCQSSDSGTRSLPEFLLSFGVMLPPPNYCADDNDDERQLFNQIKTITPDDVDAHVLSRLCGVRFQWVDSLSCHLELGKRSSTLYIYRYPSVVLRLIEVDGQKSTLHPCALAKKGLLPWADEEDVNGVLGEILLSYRVIFGQNKRSRNVFFRKLRPFASVPKHGQDQSLAEICGRKRFKCPFMPAEREEYDSAIHFPPASNKKPRSLRRLWEDRRDSPAWLAYWSAIVFFGSVGLLLVLIQTLFQILQYVDQVRHSGTGD